MPPGLLLPGVILSPPPRTTPGSHPPTPTPCLDHPMLPPNLNPSPSPAPIPGFTPTPPTPPTPYPLTPTPTPPVQPLTLIYPPSPPLPPPFPPSPHPPPDFSQDGWRLSAAGRLEIAPPQPRGAIPSPVLCPVSTYNANQGATSPEACLGCPPGRYKPHLRHRRPPLHPPLHPPYTPF